MSRRQYIGQWAFRVNLPAQPEIDLILLQPGPWHRGRILLIGDVVHTVTAHLGQGAAQAIEDAVVLAEELESRPTLDEAFTPTPSVAFDGASSSSKAAIGQHDMRHIPGFDQAAVARRVVETMAGPL